LPTISVVVPNFNGVRTLDRTLKSLFSQDYPGLEVIVCDGGSTDGSADVIARHADRLALYCSEPDRGQSHAINKGFAGIVALLVKCLSGLLINYTCCEL
jgi:glycosyltransferase involved in cell wall biosynthesis